MSLCLSNGEFVTIDIPSELEKEEEERKHLDTCEAKLADERKSFAAFRNDVKWRLDKLRKALV